MKNKSIAIRIIITVLSLVLICSMLSSCGIVNLILNYSAASALQAKKDFNDVEYKRPDFEAIKIAFEDVINEIEKGNASFFTQLEVSNAYAAYNDAYTQYNIAQINFYKDVNDKTAEEETEYCSAEFAKLDPIVNKLYCAIIDANLTETFMPDWTATDFKRVEVQKKLFDDEYAALMAERQNLENDYLALTSTVTAEFIGKQYTYDEFSDLINSEEGKKYSQENIRSFTKAYYSAYAHAAFPIYKRLIQIDNTIAKKAGYDSYAKYAYELIYQRDYTPEDTKQLSAYAKSELVPLYKSVFNSLNRETVASVLTKKDATIPAYKNQIVRYAKEVSLEMVDAYNFMQNKNYYAIGNAKGMQQAGFTTFLPSLEAPFLYLYTNDNIDDVGNFIHEFGHFFAYYKNQYESDNVLDVSEIQSQANEWLFMPYYNLTNNELTEYALYNFAESLNVILDGFLMDEFQQVIYDEANADITFVEICQLFTGIASQYDYESVLTEDIVPYYWALIPHNFTTPFYYVSYAMSAIPALEIYSLSLDDRDEAIEVYLEIVDETGYSDYLDTLKETGLTSPFEKEVFMILEGIPEKIKKEYS